MYMAPYGYVPTEDIVNMSGTAAAQEFFLSPDLFAQGVLHGGIGTAGFVATAATENMSGVVHDLASNATPMGEPLAYIAGEELGSSAVMEVVRKGVALPFGPLMNVRRK